MADDAPPPSAPLWIVSFGDMISNMVTFFILLAAFSTPSEADTNSTTMSPQTNEKGVFDKAKKKRAMVAKAASNDAKLETEGAEKPSERAEVSTDRKLDTFVMNSDYKVKPDFERLADGLRIIVQADRMFAPGDATLRPEAAEVIAEIGRYFRGESCEYVVEAHVDGRSHRYAGDASPLGLSRRMAIATAAWLHTEAGVETHRISIAPRGAAEPVASDDEAAGRAKNRRVVIFVRKTS